MPYETPAKKKTNQRSHYRDIERARILHSFVAYDYIFWMIVSVIENELACMFLKDLILSLLEKFQRS